MQHTTLLASITEIGETLVQCAEGCTGASTLEDGTPPRCLYLDLSKNGRKGVVVVGLNPGRAKPRELASYQKHEFSYQSTVDHMAKARIAYYTKLRDALPRLGFDGPILWTEVAKCQLVPNVSSVPAEMQRHCSSIYLQEELRLCSDWPIVATGWEAFRAVAFLVPGRSVIGVPHPTGARGGAFERATGKAEGKLSQARRATIEHTHKNSLALWLPDAEA